MDTANRSFPSLPVVVTSAPSSLPSSLPSSSMAAVQQPSQPFPSPPLQPSNNYFGGGALPLQQPSLVNPTTILPGGQQQSSSTSWSSARNHQQVCELPLHQNLPPQTAWLPPVGGGGIQHINGSEMTCSGGNSGSVQYFSPAPGTMSIHQQQQPSQQSRLVGPGISGLPGTTTTTLYNGSLFYNSSSNSGLGMAMNSTSTSSSTGLVNSVGSNNNCYSLFSGNGGGGIGDTAPFSAVGGLLNLDTSPSLANHVRHHQVVSTGSPLSVSSDVSSDGQNSTTGGGADSCSRVDQSDASRQVETIGLADSKGHGVSVGKPSYDEWPNL